MTLSTTGKQTRDARTLPLRRILPRLLRDPIKTIEEIGQEIDGEIVRLNLGTFRPYLVTHPDHVHHVFRGNHANYVRDGVLWRQLHRLFGEGILSDGEIWRLSRNALNPAFTAKHIEALSEEMARTVADAITQVAREAAGRPVDATVTLARIVNKTVVRLFFGDRITFEQSEKIIPAHDMIATSLVSRLLFPLVPEAIPLPGDRAFRRAIRTYDSVMVPLSKEQNPGGDGNDIFSLLSRARDRHGQTLPPTWVRDNLVAVFAAGTETTVGALTWLWPILESHPHVAARLREEIDRVVGTDMVRPAHLPDLVYTKMVIQELLRLYPVGWLLPRRVVESEPLGGVTLQAGAHVLISPFLTHRLPSVWERPREFDPERFNPEIASRRHRYAYFPFGGGPHQCLGMHLFDTEALYIVAGLLSRFRLTLARPIPLKPKAAVPLRPTRRVEIILTPASEA